MYLDWKEQPRDVFLVDIEADSLTPSVLWCMCWQNLKTGETGDCIGHNEIVAFFNEHDGSIFVGHNALSFDIPVINEVLGLDIPLDDVIDTLILSTLYSPSLQGGHSLGAWGEKLGEKKGDFHDFSRFSTEMLMYCRQDVKVNGTLFRRLIKTLQGVGFTERAITIQHKFTQIINRQKANGFEFDQQRALSLYSELRSREAGLTEIIREAFPAPLVEVGHYKAAYKKDGNPSANFLRHEMAFEKVEIQRDGSYKAYDRIEFSVGSPKQRVEKLLALGWEPEEFTPVTDKGGGGTPKPFDKGKLSPSLERFLEKTPVPEVEMIARWMSINGRANMINTWLDNYNDDTGRIHGKLFVADTLRLRHQAPNTANIPAVRTTKAGDVLYGEAGYYTYEARDLWVARLGRVLVGTDAAGLELRMLAHYLRRPDFTKQVVEGDPHQYNADVVGITRPQAKTLIYAIMYGAAAPKIAKTLGVTVKEGARIRNLFLERLGLKELIEECQDEQKNGRVSLVDGSQVICPSPHAALNYKLQGGGARVMAASAIILERNIDRYGLDSLKVGDIHDEWQYDVNPDDAIPHAILGEEAIRTAGVYLGMSVPLDGESKIGRTWAETH